MLREDNWPPRTNDGFVIFGEESVSRLAKQFGLSSRAAVQAFRNYKLEGGKPELELKRLFELLKCFQEVVPSVNGVSR